MPKNEIHVTVENFQLIGDDMVRVDLSFVGDLEQDGKELTLNHERQTIYVRKNKGPRFEMYGVTPRVDPRQKGQL